jgi:hypothetical protein
VQTICFSICPAGKYYANQYCATCNITNCVACSSADACMTCIPGLSPNVTGNYSTCVCPGRQYYNFDNSACEACPFDCLTCDSNGHCLTCSSTQDHRQLNTSNARCVPMIGYYESGVTLAGACLENC